MSFFTQWLKEKFHKVHVKREFPFSPAQKALKMEPKRAFTSLTKPLHKNNTVLGEEKGICIKNETLFECKRLKNSLILYAKHFVGDIMKEI